MSGGRILSTPLPGPVVPTSTPSVRRRSAYSAAVVPASGGIATLGHQPLAAYFGRWVQLGGQLSQPCGQLQADLAGALDQAVLLDHI